MIIRDSSKRNGIKSLLTMALKKEHAFWSYEEKSVSNESIDDDQLIALTMRHLDIKEIGMLFDIYSKKKIKSAWKRLLVPEGDYLYTLNRFFAWYYFKSKKPDAYLKSLETRRLNQMTAS